jgi:hypothetical protein
LGASGCHAAESAWHSSFLSFFTVIRRSG